VPSGIPNRYKTDDMHFPAAGLDLSRAFGKQFPRKLPDGTYRRSTPVGVNVRAFDTLLNRARGGSRPGFAKYVPAAVVAGWVIQQLDFMSGVGYAVPGGSVQLSQSGRVVTLVAVSQGDVYVASPGDTAWTATTNATSETPPLNFTGVMFSAANNQKLWFADGINWCYYDPSDNTVKTWAATAGSLPVDEDNNTPRLICTWRGRTVLSGLIKDPQNIFLSKVSDPTNFDYSPQYTSPTDAVALNLSPLGYIGDVVTCLIPYNDDVLIVGCDSHIYMIHGDPMAGGQVDLVSNTIGMAWGMPYCMDPFGNVFFVSNNMGVYQFQPGQQPVRISQAVEQLLQNANTGTNAIRMFWNDRMQGFDLYVTPLAEPGPATHFTFERRTGGWFTKVFANTDLNPLCGCVVDGNLPGDRAVVIGGWDGYVRTESLTATDDDGTAIASAVWLGPMLTKDLDEVFLNSLQMVLGESSGAVTGTVHGGRTAEEALSASAFVTLTWAAGRNLTDLIRCSAHAIYIKLASTVPWQMENARIELESRGLVRRRGR
jgi:hypothetical protein